MACKFGEGCTRKNPEHFAEYAHPLAKLRALPAGHPHRVEAGAGAPKEFLAAAPEATSDGPKADMWGRPYESSVYQWLPAEVTVRSDGSCKFDSYINNLPREQHALYAALESLLALSIPHLEVAWSYGKTIEFYDGNEDVLCDMDEDLREYVPRRVSLRGKQLQVIVKIADFELAPGATHEGVWHVEGHEPREHCGLSHPRSEEGFGTAGWGPQVQKGLLPGRGRAHLHGHRTMQTAGL